MTIVSGPEFGVKYTLTGPDGSRAVFNDPTDPDYVGYLKDVTGLDSPDVRESSEDLTGLDGGIHGDFFYGRRPVVLEGIIEAPVSASARNARMMKLQMASNAMRDDAVLKWTPSGGVENYVTVRRQQPLRIRGGWNKEFQCALVAADPRIYGSTLNERSDVAGGGLTSPTGGRAYSRTYDSSYGPGGSVFGEFTVTNEGSAETFPILTITGPCTNPLISNWTTGQDLRMNYTLGDGDTLTFDMLNRTIVLNGTASRYGYLDFFNSEWWPLVPGGNELRLTFDSYSSPAALEVAWRHAWL
ncbi:MAG: phage tail family protein [Acidobacteria bacterium]|nr:phage tail family protein [Acidobacteriota bacterium]